MGTRFRPSVVFFVVLVLLWGGAPAAGPGIGQAWAATSKITLIHVGDTHSHLDPTGLKLDLGGDKTYVQAGGFSRLAALVKAERAKAGPENVLLLHAGDAFQGTLYFTLYQGQAEAELMNLMGFTAMVLGNHEFDQGPETLARFVAAVRFPVLSANTDAAGEPSLKGAVAPYKVVEAGGRKVGLIGLTTPDTAFISTPGQGIKFTDPVGTARSMVQELGDQGVNIIIVLSHLGVEQDVNLVKTVEGLDVVVGGHSHTLLGDFGDIGLVPDGAYPILISGPRGEKVPVAHAWKWTQSAGIMDLEFDDRGRLVSFSGRPALMLADKFERKNEAGEKIGLAGEAAEAVREDIAAHPALRVEPDDPEVAAVLAKYRQGLEELEKKVVAKVSADVLHVRVPGETHEESGRVLATGSQVAPLAAEAMLWKLKSLGLDVQAYLINAGDVRVDLPAGDLTVGRVYSLLPFGNTIYTLELSGAEFKAALENGLAAKGTGAFPYLAGARYEADPARPAGARLVRLEVKTKDGGFAPVDEKAVYTIGVNAFLAGGGDGYEVLAKAEGRRYDTGYVEAEVFLEYAAGRGTLEPPTETGVKVSP
ncbi:MAG: 5'-nucleotidase C-terminal domain-containing protein [Thermodesulfobacteriota bacterium]